MWTRWTWGEATPRGAGQTPEANFGRGPSLGDFSLALLAGTRFSEVMRLAVYIIMAILLSGTAAQAATGRINKVLPHFLDASNKVALSPSLFERDAYQNHLRLNPEKRAGLRFSVQWKCGKTVWAPVKIRLELRGTAEGNLPKQLSLEKTVQPGGWFGKWTHLDLTGQEYKAFGEVTAWRATLWEGEELLHEQKSFLW
jgi:hypothetical protein